MQIAVRIQHVILLFVLTCAGAAWAQPTDGTIDYTIRGDEVRLEGTIKTLDRITGQFVLNVDVTVSQGDESGEIAAPGPHRIQVTYNTSIVDRRTGVQNLGFDNLAAGTEAIVIGHSKGNGQFVEARLVAVSRSVAIVNAPIILPSRRQRLMGAQGSAPWTLPPLRPVPRRPQAHRPQPRSTRHALRTPRSTRPVRIKSAPRATPRPVAPRPGAPRPAAPQPARHAPTGVPASPRLVVSTPRPVAPPVVDASLRHRAEARAAAKVTPPRPARLVTAPDPVPLAAASRLATRSVAPRPTPAFRTAPSPAAPASPPARLAMGPGRSDNTLAPSGPADHSTKPLGTSAAAAALASLNALARTNFHALKMAQDDIHYAYFSNGSSQEKLVALTFDDGPNPIATPRVLDILKRERVAATFFVIGRNAEKYPQVVLRAIAEGHSIGNHTFHHHQGVELTLEEWRSEIELTNDVIMHLVGVPTRWFRAPGCHYTPEALQAIHEMSMVRVDTTNNSSDWDKRSAASICQRILSELAPGNVILMHDPMPQTAVALPILIHQIKAQGYRFVSLEELAQRAQATPGFFPQFRPPGQGIVITAKE